MSHFERLRSFGNHNHLRSCFVPRRSGGRPRHQRVLLPHVRGQRGPGVPVRRPRHEGGRGEPDPALWADALAAPDGAAPAQVLRHAPVPHDVLAGARRRLHDHEVPVQLAHLPHHGQHVPAAAFALGGHRHRQPALCRQPLEHQLFR